MYKALVCCRAGMGSSMLLKIKADQVINENNFPIKTEHGNLDSIVGFTGDLVITMDAVSDTHLDVYKRQFLRFLKNFQSRYFCEKSMVMYKSYLNCCLQNKMHMLLY